MSAKSVTFYKQKRACSKRPINMEGKMISVSFKRRILAASVVAGALLATSGNSYALDKVVVAQGIPQLTPAFAFMSSVPMEMGYFKEEGLDVEVATTPG